MEVQDEEEMSLVRLAQMIWEAQEMYEWQDLIFKWAEQDLQAPSLPWEEKRVILDH